MFYNFIEPNPTFYEKSAFSASLLKQFTYMSPKVLITGFQKMIWFIRGLSHRPRDVTN